MEMSNISNIFNISSTSNIFKSITITVDFHEEHYELQLNKKITLVGGDSWPGRGRLTNLLRAAYSGFKEIKITPDIKLTVEENRFSDEWFRENMLERWNKPSDKCKICFITDLFAWKKWSGFISKLVEVDSIFIIMTREYPDVFPSEMVDYVQLGRDGKLHPQTIYTYNNLKFLYNVVDEDINRYTHLNEDIMQLPKRTESGELDLTGNTLQDLNIFLSAFQNLRWASDLRVFLDGSSVLHLFATGNTKKLDWYDLTLDLIIVVQLDYKIPTQEEIPSYLMEKLRDINFKYTIIPLDTMRYAVFNQQGKYITTFNSIKVFPNYPSITKYQAPKYKFIRDKVRDITQYYITDKYQVEGTSISRLLTEKILNISDNNFTDSKTAIEDLSYILYISQYSGLEVCIIFNILQECMPELGEYRIYSLDRIRWSDEKRTKYTSDYYDKLLGGMTKTITLLRDIVNNVTQLNTEEFTLNHQPINKTDCNRLLKFLRMFATSDFFREEHYWNGSKWIKGTDDHYKTFADKFTESTNDVLQGWLPDDVREEKEDIANSILP